MDTTCEDLASEVRSIRRMFSYFCWGYIISAALAAGLTAFMTGLVWVAGIALAIGCLVAVVWVPWRALTKLCAVLARSNLRQAWYDAIAVALVLCAVGGFLYVVTPQLRTPPVVSVVTPAPARIPAVRTDHATPAGSCLDIVGDEPALNACLTLASFRRRF